MVRLGAGSQSNIQSSSEPITIDPFVLTLKLSEGEKQIEFNEQGDLLVDGVTISAGRSDRQSADACYQLVD